jgi:hypothetical protein
MGMKLAAVMAVLMFAMGGAFYWYYNDTQERIGVLRENNAKLEVAMQTAEDSMNLMKDEMARNQELMKGLSARLQKAEKYGDDLRNKLRQLDLVQDAIKDAKKLEGKMNGATAKLWRGIEQDTGGAGDKPLPDWLQPVQPTGTGDQGSNEAGKDGSTDSNSAEASPAN